MSIRPPGLGRVPAGPDLHLLTGARALDALDSAEAEEFDAHLATCPSCAEEYAGLRETAALLGAALASPAPQSMRAAVLARVSATPQQPPRVSHRSTRRTPSVLRRPVTWLLAAAVAAGITFGAVALWPTGATQQFATPQECVAQAADVTIAKPVVGEGGEVHSSPSCKAAVVQLPAMPALPQGRTYQLWLIDGSGAHPAGLVSATDEGSAATSMAMSVPAGTTAVGVTQEPDGGSKEPTTPVLWKVPLS